VSTNGLTVEGSASKGWIEASLQTDNPDILAEVWALFEEVWSRPDTTRVRKSDIETARRRRAGHSIPAAAPLGRTLLQACREQPRNFQSVYVAAYDEDLGPHGRQLLKQVRDGALAPKRGLSTSNFRKAWGYQYDNIPDDAWLIDLNCKGRKPRFSGCAKATGLRLPVQGENDLTIAIPGVVRAPGSGVRLPLSSSEKASLLKNVRRFLSFGDDLVPLPNALKIIDRKRRV
jgi:hypothetical protein